ncbi:MAG TPA: hypothetical protein VGT98_04280, partial [Candidatus Elarobacter sp.]|nr:hypothetical protein [Candidatus Elarobacter sp.]
KPFTIVIGINTCDVIAGDAGFRERREFTVVGSEATMAHRLQEAAFVLNAYIVAARSTCASHLDEYQLVPIAGVPLAGVRRLLDAFVVRGRNRGVEKFTVPVDALVETTIEPSPPNVVPAPAPAPAAKPAVAEAELPVARPRPRPTATATRAPELGLPELQRGWMFPQDEDARPILPDPPARRATYEDGGPPLDY